MLAPAVAEKCVAKSARMSAKGGGHNVPWSGYMGAIAQDAFDHTTTGVVSTEQRVLSAEKNAYGAMAPGFTEDALMDSFGGLSFGAMAPAKEDRAPAFITKEEWNESHEFHRKGVEWRENMTFERARIYADDYDEREFRKMLIQKGGEQYGFVTGTVPGFIAGTLGSLPDPINLIPIGRAFGAGRGFWGGLRQGAIEGALSSAAVDAVTLPDLKRRGEDVGFADLTMDVAFGAAVGGLFGGAGGWLGKRRDARGVNEFARTRIHGQARKDILIAQEAAVSDVVNGRGVDVSGVLSESDALARMYEQALFNPLLSSDPHSPSVRLMYADLAQELGVKLGDIFVDIGTATLRPNGSLKIKTPFGMIKFIWKHGEGSHKDASARVLKDDIVNFVKVLRDYVPEKSPQGYDWIVKNAEGIHIVYGVKNFSETTGRDHLVTVYALTSEQTKKRCLSKKRPAMTSPDSGSRPLSGIPHGELPKPRSSVGSMTGSDNKMPIDIPSVNRFATEAPEEFSPAPPVSERTQSAYDAMGLEQHAGANIDAIQTVEQTTPGRANSETLEGLRSAQETEATPKHSGESGLTSLSNIMEDSE